MHVVKNNPAVIITGILIEAEYLFKIKGRVLYIMNRLPSQIITIVAMDKNTLGNQVGSNGCSDKLSANTPKRKGIITMIQRNTISFTFIKLLAFIKIKEYRQKKRLYFLLSAIRLL